MLNISNLALATPSRVYVLYYAAAVDCGHSHSHSVSHAAVGFGHTLRRPLHDSSSWCCCAPSAASVLACDSFGVNCMSVGQGVSEGGRGRRNRVAVIVARVLQLPAFDYNAPHVGVLHVCVCVLGILGALRIHAILTVLGIRWFRVLCARRHRLH